MSPLTPEIRAMAFASNRRFVLSVVGALDVCVTCMSAYEYGLRSDLDAVTNPWSRLGPRERVTPDYAHDGWADDGRPVGPCQACGDLTGGDRFRFDLWAPVPLALVAA